MKTILLKLALCAVATLPIGAWGQTSWDFRSWSSKTIAKLDSVATTTTPSTESTAYRKSAVWNKKEGTSDNEGSYYYDYYEIYQNGGSDQSAQVLKAGENVIRETEGLTFYIPNNAKSRLRIDNRTKSKALFLSSKSEKINIPGLMYGKKVTITCKGNTRGTNSQMVCENANAVAYKQTEASTAKRTDVFVINYNVTSATTMAFKINDGSMNIYTISIEDATEDEKNYANSKVLFGSDDVITTTSLWNFEQYKTNDNIDGTGSGSNYAGLYIKGHTTSGSNASKIQELSSSVNTYGSMVTPNTSLCHWFAGGRQLSYSEAKNRKASDYLPDNIGLNIGVAGTLYVTASSSAGSATNYKITITRGNSDDTQNISTADEITSLGLVLTRGDITTKNTPVVYSASVTKAGTYWISATGAYNVHAVAFIPASGKQVEKTKTVTLSAAGGGYATFSAPQSYTVPEGVTAYYVSAVDASENKTTLKAITAGNVIPACTGVILYKDGVSSDTEVTLTSSETYSAVTNQMQPNLAAYALAANNGSNYNYTLAYEDGSPVFKHSSGSGTLAAGKAFLRTTVNVPGADTGEGSRIALVFDDSELTGISEVKSVVNDGKFYNLQGVEVKAPAKGLFIVNGKKVVIK